MAKRPEAHKIGEIGQNEVERIFLQQGWIVNRIHSDYGEDIAVQPSSGGIAEKYRMYVQIKAVDDVSRKRIQLRNEDLFLWQLLKEPFLVVCWLTRRKRAKFIWVNQVGRPEDYADFNKKTVSLPISKLRPLDAKNLALISAQIRNLFYEDILQKLSKYMNSHDGYGANALAPEMLKMKTAAINIAVRLLEQDGVLVTRKGKVYASADFLLANWEEISRLGYGRYVHPDDGMWALAVIEHVWTKKYHHAPSILLYWAMTNVLVPVLTGNPGFKALVKKTPDPFLKKHRTVRRVP